MDPFDDRPVVKASTTKSPIQDDDEEVCQNNFACFLNVAYVLIIES